MLYLLTFFSFLIPSNLYFDADPFYLFYYESQQFNQNEYDVNLNIRPALKSNYKNITDISYNAWYYYNDNAPNLENTSNRYVGKGSSFYNSIHFDYFNDFILFSIEPYIHISENLHFINQHLNPVFQALNDGPAHENRPYIDYGLRETQLILQKNSYGIGFANTNMWWGPGTHNSLHMSNNTSGFNYFFMGTTSEKRISSFGYDIKYIFSKLDKTNYEPYFTGFATSLTYYSDPIITLGLFRSFLSGGTKSSDNISMTDAMLLPFEAFFKNKLAENAPNNNPDDDADQTASFFMSILFPKSKFKLYLEYGWNDHRWDLSDFFQHFDHTSASIIGFRKYGLFNNHNIISGFEFTNIVSPDYTRGGGSWYSREMFDFHTYDGRRFTAHSGFDSDDIFFYLGYLSIKKSLIVSFNFERHGVNYSIIKSENDNLFNLFYVPEYKIEFKIDVRHSFDFGEIFIIYEFEFYDNLGFPIQQANPSFKTENRKSNVFGIGFSKNIK
jgi:hypothetical protein